MISKQAFNDHIDQAMKKSKDSQQEAITIERREAMAKLGKYAACTAAAMVTMLTPQKAFGLDSEVLAPATLNGENAPDANQ